MDGFMGFIGFIITEVILFNNTPSAVNYVSSEVYWTNHGGFGSENLTPAHFIRA